MDTIILYTTHCPKCEVLEKKLKQKILVRANSPPKGLTNEIVYNGIEI